MFDLETVDHCNRGRKLQKRPVIFIGLDHHVSSLPDNRTAFQIIGYPADHDRR